MCALNVSCLIRRAAFEAGCSACRTSEAQEWRRRAAVTPSAARPPGKRAAHGSAEGGSCREGRPQGPGSPSEGREGEPGRQAGPVPVCGLLREQGPRADGPASDRQGAVSRPRGPRTPSGPSATTRRAHGCSSASNVLPPTSCPVSRGRRAGLRLRPLCSAGCGTGGGPPAWSRLLWAPLSNSPAVVLNCGPRKSLCSPGGRCGEMPRSRFCI